MLPALAPHLDPFIAEILPLAAVPAAYERLLAGDTNGIKTLIQIGDGHDH
jgi:(R,R)-butanediol dehydrogenase/meso-butanediol dehydrogenase/diacetyl reductase